MSMLPAKKYPNPTEINGKIHANLNRRRLSLSHLMLHVHSPFSALSSRRQFTPTSLAIARSPLAARLQTAGHGQWGPGGEHRPWEKKKLQVQPPANESTQRLLQCRYNQETIFFHFHRTINLIYIALTTNEFCLGYEQMHVQYACKLMAYAICVYPLVPCAHVILLIDIYSCAHSRARSALELNSYI